MRTSKNTLLKITRAGIFALLSASIMSGSSYAEVENPHQQPCSSADYFKYQHRVKTEPVEGSPDELLILAEQYLSVCQARPEAGRVALKAARNALDTGNAQKAQLYFDLARSRWAVFQRQHRLDYMTTLILNGDAPLAWELRDEEIDLWLSKLSDDQLGEIETIRMRDGLVYKVTYDVFDPAFRETVAWIAVPFGDGFPATISLSSEKSLIGLLKLSLGNEAEGLKQLRLRRCHGSDLLWSDTQGISEQDADEMAIEVAKAYLANPDRVEPSKPHQPIATCFDVDRLLIAPDLETATTRY